MIAGAIAFATRLVVGGYARGLEYSHTSGPRIYFANHSSHLDTIILWSALPGELRARTHPVAARDYWDSNALRRLIAYRGLKAVLIDRNASTPKTINPLAEACRLLAAGESLIIFPEGTRSNERLPMPFKSGIFHLAQSCPEAELVPVYLVNPRRAYPKGAILPAPITCTAKFGTPMALGDDELKAAFLARTHEAVCALAEGEI